MKYLVIVLLLTAFPAFARLGETRAQCIARYGEPFETGKEAPTLAFKKSGIIIVCEYLEEKCASIGYLKDEDPNVDGDEEFSDVELEVLRAANGEGKKWVEVEEAPIAFKTWQIPDNGRRFIYRRLDQMVIVQTKTFIDMAAAAIKAAEKADAEKKKMEGF